jgi:hypothetical protein
VICADVLLGIVHERPPSLSKAWERVFSDIESKNSFQPKTLLSSLPQKTACGQAGAG